MLSVKGEIPNKSTREIHTHPSISEAVYFDMEDLRDKVFYLFGFGF